MNLDKMKRWTELNREKTRINAERKKVTDEMAELAPQIVGDLIAEECAGLKVGGYSLHMRTDSYVGIKEDIEVIDPETMKSELIDGVEYLRNALISHGFGSIVKPGTASLKALVKSFEDEDQEVPEWLSQALVITSKTSLAARKS